MSKKDWESSQNDSEQSRKHRRVIQNIFLSKGMNQQNSSESSNGDAVRKSLSFGIGQMRRDCFRESDIATKRNANDPQKKEFDYEQMLVLENQNKKSNNHEHIPLLDDQNQQESHAKEPHLPAYPKMMPREIDPNMSSKDSDHVLVRTESHYVQKFGSGVYQEQPGFIAMNPSKQSFNKNRIDRITEESESRDKQTFSRHQENNGSQHGLHNDNSEYTHSVKRMRKKKFPLSSQALSAKTDPLCKMTEEREQMHEKKKTMDSIKKYLDFYDYESEHDDPNSYVHELNNSRKKIEAHTLEFLENYEATDDQTSPTETDNKVPSKKVTSNSSNTREENRELSASKSMEHIRRQKSQFSLPKYRTVDEVENVYENEHPEDNPDIKFRNSKKENDQKFIEIRNMILQNSAKSYSNEAKATYEEDSITNGKLWCKYKAPIFILLMARCSGEWFEPASEKQKSAGKDQSQDFENESKRPATAIRVGSKFLHSNSNRTRERDERRRGKKRSKIADLHRYSPNKSGHQAEQESKHHRRLGVPAELQNEKHFFPGIRSQHEREELRVEFGKLLPHRHRILRKKRVHHFASKAQGR